MGFQVINGLVLRILIQVSDSGEVVSEQHYASFLPGVWCRKQDSHLCGMEQHYGLKAEAREKSYHPP